MVPLTVSLRGATLCIRGHCRRTLKSRPCSRARCKLRLCGVYSNLLRRFSRGQEADGGFAAKWESDWNLRPTVWRHYAHLQEKYLTNLFYTRAKIRHTDCPAREDFGGWLALMQHYRLPTRVLDWTSSPLVAACFATKHCHELGLPFPATGAAVWALEPHRLNESQGYEPIFPPPDLRGSNVRSTRGP